MSCNTLSIKGPDEDVIVSFDFTNALDSGEYLVSIVSVTVSVVLGIDPNPSALLNGPAAIDATGTVILQPVWGGLDATNYHLRALAVTSAGSPPRQLAVPAILPVRYT